MQSPEQSLTLLALQVRQAELAERQAALDLRGVDLDSREAAAADFHTHLQAQELQLQREAGQLQAQAQQNQVCGSGLPCTLSLCEALCAAD